MGQEVLFPRRSPSAGLKEYTVSGQEPFCKHQHSSFADKMLLVLEMGGRAGRCRVISVLKELLSSLDHEPGHTEFQAIPVQVLRSQRESHSAPLSRFFFAASHPRVLKYFTDISG